jgi:hypothetical protein
MTKKNLKLIGRPIRKISAQKIIQPPEKSYEGPKIPSHFQKNTIVTYSQAEIEAQLNIYPGLLKTLGHAYDYQITVISNNDQKDYWFCRNLKCSLPLLKYLNEQGWNVDWQEKPFTIV